MPAGRERARTEAILSGIDNVMLVEMECGSRVFASDELCAEVFMKDGAKIHFSRLGFNSFGITAKNIVVSEASGLEPRVASCNGTSAPNFQRDSVLGHHFEPPLIDVSEAVKRYRHLLKEVRYWPRCPLYWEVQDRTGANFRYCARKKGTTEEPPLPDGCR